MPTLSEAGVELAIGPQAGEKEPARTMLPDRRAEIHLVPASQM